MESNKVCPSVGLSVLKNSVSWFCMTSKSLPLIPLYPMVWLVKSHHNVVKLFFRSRIADQQQHRSSARLKIFLTNSLGRLTSSFGIDGKPATSSATAVPTNPWYRVDFGCLGYIGTSDSLIDKEIDI